ncbi:MAG: response regulator transcription factor [Flavobacteriales bacterium]|nr:response regulator transcription factor [Flavobacteriales bacterium]
MERHRALIIDDEVGSIKALEWELKLVEEQVELVGSATDPEKGLRLLQELKPDLLFLDIEMPGMNGFELLERAGPIDGQVIFTTAYDKFAVRAFEVSALDYLLKPVDEGELARVLQKVQATQGQEDFQRKLEFLLGELRQKDPDLRTIVVPTTESLEFISVDTISRFEAESNYTRIHLTDGRPLLMSRTLKHVETMVEGMGFFRVHNSHLVNVRFIKRMLRGDPACLVMQDGSTVPVSRGRKGDLLERF